MQKFPFVIEVAAHNAKEAEAKLDLFLQLGAFFEDFDVSKLAGSFLNYQLLHYLSKWKEKRQNSFAAGTNADKTKTTTSE